MAHGDLVLFSSHGNAVDLCGCYAVPSSCYIMKKAKMKGRTVKLVLPTSAQLKAAGVYSSSDLADVIPTLLPGIDERATFAASAADIIIRTDKRSFVLRVPNEADQFAKQRWWNALHMLEHIKQTRSTDWKGAAKVSQVPAETPASLSIGDPVGLRGPALGRTDATGGWLVEHRGKNMWRVQLPTAGDVIDTVPGSLAPLPNWPFLGVSVMCLRQFMNAHCTQLEGASTEEVCDRVIKPLTKAAHASLAACLLRVGAVDKAGCPLVAKATAFISHARKYRFADLVEAVALFVDQQDDPSSVYVWIDVFSQNQHWLGDVGSDRRIVNWDVVFQLTIASIGLTCLVLAPWRAPVPLERAWILWELLCTVQSEAHLHIQVPPAEAASFEEALLYDFDSITGSISSIDSRQAKCWTQVDEQMIHESIRRSVGHSVLNKRVSDELRAWLASVGRTALDRLPADKRGTSMLINQVAQLLEAQGRLDEAAPLYRESLAARLGLYGKQHPETLSAMSNLAVLLKAQSKLNEAEPLFQEVLKMRRTELGARHPSTLSAMNNLAGLLKAQNKLTLAAALYRKTLAARQTVLGMQHSSTITSMNNLAVLLKTQGKLAEAEPLYRMVLALRIKTAGDRHQDTLGATSNLAGLLAAQGKIAEAKSMYREALSLYRETLGDHPFTLATMNNLAGLLQTQGLLDEAAPLYEEALQAQRKILGARHPETLATQSNLALLLKTQGKLEDAEPLYREALASFRATLGARHPTTLTLTGNLGGLLYSMRKLEEATALFQEVMIAHRHSLGSRHPQTLSSVRNLAGALYVSHRFDESEQLYCELLSVQRSELGSEHSDTLTTISTLAEVLQEQNRSREAGVLLMEVMSSRRSTLGNLHPDTLSSIYDYALHCKNCGKLKKAAALFREELAGCDALHGASHKETIGSARNLVKLLRQIGEANQADTLEAAYRLC